MLREIKTHFTAGAVLSIVKLLGYEVNRSGQFRLREERTPSTSINPRTGWIRDWGGDFEGDVFDLLHLYHGMDFPEAVEYVAGVLGLSEECVEVVPAQRFKPIHRPPSYDLKKIYEKMRNGRSQLVRRMGKAGAKEHMARNLFPVSLFPWIDRETADRMIGFDSKYDSFVISLFDDEEVKTVALQRAGSVKWKTYGKKSFIPYRMDDSPVVYAVFGMKEILLLECTGWSYVGFQSDSVAKSVARNERATMLKEDVRGKVIALLLDNDESCRATMASLRAFFDESVVVAVDFADLLHDRKLPKGYDFYDFVTWCGRMDIARWMIDDYIDAIPPYDGTVEEVVA